MKYMLSLVVILVFAAAGCGSSVSGDDGDADDADDDTAGDSLPDPATDESTDPPLDSDVIDGELVRIGCYELEIAVNVDAPEGESMMRWYGGLYPADEGTPVTNCSVSSLEIVDGGATRVMIDAALEGYERIDLPMVQREVTGKVVLTAGEVSLCSGSGPALHRGAPGADEVQVLMHGTSDQGEWHAGCEVEGDQKIITCHSGISRMAGGMADVWPNPEPPPATLADLNVYARVSAGSDFDDVSITSFILHGEGTSATFDATSSATGFPEGAATPPDQINIYYQEEGPFGDELCPAIDVGIPPELFVTYEGTAGTMPFAGTAVTGPCQNFTDEI